MFFAVNATAYKAFGQRESVHLATYVVNCTLHSTRASFPICVVCVLQNRYDRVTSALCVKGRRQYALLKRQFSRPVAHITRQFVMCNWPCSCRTSRGIFRQSRACLGKANNADCCVSNSITPTQARINLQASKRNQRCANTVCLHVRNWHSARHLLPDVIHYDVAEERPLGSYV